MLNGYSCFLYRPIALMRFTNIFRPSTTVIKTINCQKIFIIPFNDFIFTSAEIRYLGTIL